MDYTDFEDFNSPAGGVELSDTLADWRQKTNGIIMKIDSLETGINAASNIDDNAIALEKIEQVANLKVLGNTSGSTANVSEVSVLDEDTLSSDSATALATQQSIKAYVDGLFDEYSLKVPTSNTTGTFSTTGGSGSYDEIDLSNAIGSTKALVVLAVYDVSGSAYNLYLRTPDTAVDFGEYNSDSNAGGGSAALVVGSGDRGGHAVLMTNSSGKIEAHTTNARSGIEYEILSYQKVR